MLKLKRNKILLIVFCLLILLCGCKKEESDASKFKKEFNSVSDNNKFLINTEEDILKYIEEKKTLLLFIGSNTDEWSNSIVAIIDRVSRSEGVNINYLKLDNSTEVTNKLDLEFGSYLIGIVKGELKYHSNSTYESEITDIISDMAIEINSCDIDIGC